MDTRAVTVRVYRDAEYASPEVVDCVVIAHPYWDVRVEYGHPQAVNVETANAVLYSYAFDDLPEVVRAILDDLRGDRSVWPALVDALIDCPLTAEAMRRVLE